VRRGARWLIRLLAVAALAAVVLLWALPLWLRDWRYVFG
jgi:membrane protein YdbS with pleckstrin-like domain